MAKWIMVVDDDTANLKMAGHILSRNNMRVTALKSGQALLDYIPEKGFPDLILLDIKMPEMDGFETLKRLREYEKTVRAEKTPVIFLTADEDTQTETRGFEEGVADFVRKPFHPDVLMRRIDNVMSSRSEMKSLKSEASIDKLTGFLNKGASETELSRVCTQQTGTLMMIDLDSFKLVNDLYGHDMGDKVLVGFSRIVKNAVPQGSTCGRLGGDEFVAFAKGITSDTAVAEISSKLNRDVLDMAKDLMGQDMDIPLGASIGAIYVPRHGNDYNALIKLADKSLYIVKQNGKHGYHLYSSDAFDEESEENQLPDIRTVSGILGERSIPDVALQLDKDAFAPVYRYIMRYILRNRLTACKVLFTLDPGENTSPEKFMDLVDEFGNHIRQSLRKSDILMRYRKNQYFLFLTDIREDSTGKVISHIVDTWKEKMGDALVVSNENEFVGNEFTMIYNKKKDRHVIIVDDDAINLQVAGKILSGAGIRVSALRSGKALLSYIEEKKGEPDLILMDIKMPEMDGFETLRRLRLISSSAAKIPVVFLTAYESSGAESKGLALGATIKAGWRGMPDYTDNDTGAIISGSGLAQSGLAIMADAGFMLQFNFLKFYSSRDPNVRIGVSAQNLGVSLTGFGDQVKLDDPLPTTASAGISVRFIKPIALSVDFVQPLNLMDMGTYLMPSFNTGVSVQFASFISLLAGFSLKGANPRISTGFEFEVAKIRLNLNYTLDLASSLAPVNRISLSAKLLLGDKGRSIIDAKVDEYYQLGLKYYADAKWEDAIVVWEEALKLNKRFDPAIQGIQSARYQIEMFRMIKESLMLD